MALAASIISSLVWPLVLVTLILLFKAELKKLVPQLRSLKAGPVTADFGDRLSKVEKQAEQAEVLPPPRPDAPTTDPDDPYASAIRLAEDHPPAAVTEGWKVFEQKVRDIAQGVGFDMPPTFPIGKILRDLARRAELPAAFVETTDALRRLRNEAAHSTTLRVEGDEAIDYVEFLRRLGQDLEEKLPGVSASRL